ncbi:MAG: DUF6311 domain-containing protein [Lachnospiraceae bacterium]|nr:DUF6311 domain-containing protein [Lachnospiraceae bacterium]
MNNCADTIYNSITKKDIKKLFLIGGIIGIAVFLLCYSWKVLDVTYDQWLLSGEDISQHYIGWKFYRASDWHIPVGQIDGMLTPMRTNIVFTDSIPIFAIFFKLISPILPGTFQYFGIWGCLSYFLMGGISALIIRKATRNQWLCYIGAGIMCFSPYIFQRMYSHTALAGHWIILMALAIWIYRPWFSTFKKKVYAWGSLLIIGSLVHIYFVPMIMIFMFGFCLQDLITNEGWKEDLLFAPLVVGIDLVVLYGVGAFEKTAALQELGLGLYSANINSLFNGDKCSPYLPALPRFPEQHEGFGYLGFGIIFLLGVATATSIVYKIWRLWKKEKSETLREKAAFVISMTIVITISFILAWSPKIVFGTKVIFEIEYPDFIIKLLSIFRASGRFIWCVGYILMIFSIMIVCRYLKPIAAGIIIGLALMAQIADMQPLIRTRKNLTNAEKQFDSMQSKEWETIIAGKEGIVVMPHNYIKVTYGIRAAYEMGNFAVDHGLVVNYFPVARADEDRLNLLDNDYAYSLLNKNGNKYVYILDTEERASEYDLKIYHIDGFIVGIGE